MFDYLKSYHDTELFSVNLRKEARKLELDFLFENGERKKLILNHCSSFRILDFINQNVVSRLMVFSGEKFIKQKIIYYLRFLYSLSDSPNLLSDSAIKKIINDIQESKTNLFVLEPSRGAELVALFKSIQEESI